MFQAPDAAAQCADARRFALAAGVVGGIVYEIAAFVSLAISYGPDAVTPHVPFLTVALLLLSEVIKSMLLFGVAAALAWFALRRLGIVTQALLFGAVMGGLYPAITATLRLLIDATTHPTHGLSFQAYGETLVSEVFSSHGLALFVAGVLSWLLADRWMRRYEAPAAQAAALQATAAAQVPDQGHTSSS